MIVNGMIQQAMEMMLIVLDKCWEKKMVDLFESVRERWGSIK